MDKRKKNRNTKFVNLTVLQSSVLYKSLNIAYYSVILDYLITKD